MFDPSTDQAIALYILNKYGEEYVRGLIERAFNTNLVAESERVYNVIQTWTWNILESGDETWEDEL
jgi:hypothetical protein